MSTLSNEGKEMIETFISKNEPSNRFPLLGPQKANIKKIYRKFMTDNKELESYGSEGFSYNNCFYKHSNGKIYIVTFNMGELSYYNNFKEYNLEEL